MTLVGRAWTAKAIETLTVEAAATAMLLPRDDRPREFGNAMPETRRDWQNYGQEPSRYQRRATPAEISRMSEAWGFVNGHPVESERRLLYAWAWQKARKGRFLSDFASREGIKSKTLRRAITAICQAIADRLNRNGIVRLDDTVDALAEDDPEPPSYSVSSPNRAKAPAHWMQPDARPTAYPLDSPEMIALRKRIEKANKRRQRERKPANQQKLSS